MNRQQSKHSKSHVFPQKFVTIASIILLVFSLTVNAAFLSAGYKKGVAVSSEYYFTSNVLNGIGKNGTLSVYPCGYVSGITSLAFEIKNHNKLLVASPFDITYKIQYCLSTTSENYTYRLQYEQDGIIKTVYITSTEWTDLPVNFTFKADILSSDNFQVFFDSGDSEQSIDKAAAICVKATPVSPYVMKSYEIGAAITLSDNTEAFRVNGKFDDSISNLDDSAGFLYNLTASGVTPTGTTPQVEIVWNSDVLEISKYTNGVITYDTGSDGINYGHILKDINSGDYFSLSFYRADNWPNDATLESLKSYVNYTVYDNGKGNEP